MPFGQQIVIDLFNKLFILGFIFQPCRLISPTTITNVQVMIPLFIDGVALLKIWFAVALLYVGDNYKEIHVEILTPLNFRFFHKTYT